MKTPGAPALPSSAAGSVFGQRGPADEDAGATFSVNPSTPIIATFVAGGVGFAVLVAVQWLVVVGRVVSAIRMLVVAIVSGPVAVPGNPVALAVVPAIAKAKVTGIAALYRVDTLVAAIIPPIRTHLRQA
jgi:hypothetical protein